MTAAATLAASAARDAGRLRRMSLALFLGGFSTFSLLYCVQPLLPTFARAFGLSPAQSALALSLSTATLAAAILLAGGAAQRLNLKSLMFGSMVLAAACNLAAALAPTWPLLLAARAAEGLLLGGVPAVAMTYLAEETDPADLAAAMGLYVAGTAFGGMAGRVGMGLLLARTRLGLLLRATTQNRVMSSTLGVNTRRIDGWTFAIGSALAGGAGAVLTLIGGITPDVGQGYIVDSFLVVATGGVGKLAGAVWAGLGLGVLNKLLEPAFQAVWAKVMILGVVIVFLQWRPSGLFPAKGRFADG